MDVTTMPDTCSQCHQPFDCGAQCDHCWCADYPAILPANPDRRCLCPDCLARVIGREIQKRLADLPLEDALELARQSPRSPRIVEHIDYTLNEQHQLVLSQWYLLKRGKCCGEGCSQCPYPDSAS